MSSIKIVCRKNKYDFKDTKDYNQSKTENKLGDELIIEATQWFMNTEQFFDKVKDSLDKYFTSIEKK